MIFQPTPACGPTERIEPGRVLVVDGIFALYYDSLLPLYNLAIYVDTPDDICFARRLARDIQRTRTHARIHCNAVRRDRSAHGGEVCAAIGKARRACP